VDMGQSKGIMVANVMVFPLYQHSCTQETYTAPHFKII
jgi:hypothetical protein